VSHLIVKGLKNDLLLKSINLTVGDSECIGISGKSGSGKTMMLRALADLDPSEGEVLLDGVLREVLPGPEWRKKVGFLPAESQWWFDRVGEHFNSIETELLHAFGFDNEALNWEVSRLSTGQRQRFSLIRLLCSTPKVLLLDEPTASLDFDNIIRTEKIIKGYQKHHDTAIVWISHDISQIQRVCNRHLFMNSGTLMPFEKK
jgi:ABC-type multidrug transport system ATPase subunit